MFANPSEVAGKKKSINKLSEVNSPCWINLVEYYERKISQNTVNISNYNDGLIYEEPSVWILTSSVTLCIMEFGTCGWNIRQENEEIDEKLGLYLAS